MVNGDLTIGVVGALIGALFAGISRLMVEQYQAFKEAEGIAAALRGEITALLNLVESRRYDVALDRIIGHLKNSDSVELGDYFDPPLAREYFPIFKSIVPKIGVLRAAGTPTVKAYMLAQSVIEDVHLLQDTRRRMEAGTFHPNHDELLRITQELRRMLDTVLAAAREAIAALDRFLAKRWMGVLP